MPIIRLCTLIFGIFSAQVAPFDIPYDSRNLNLHEIESVWEIKKEFNEQKRIRLNFIPDNCSGKLFLINEKEEFSGPYDIENEVFTNPFLAKELTIQIIKNDNCQIDADKLQIAEINESIILETHNNYKINERENPVILITGYWPPTNEMIREFSQSELLNPDSWSGDNWEQRGYDIISFFPEFDDPNCNDCGQGYGQLQVDYQNTSNDFWPIVEELKPVAIITFSRGYMDNSWEIEYNFYNRTNWINDFTAPFLPTPNPPESTVQNYFIRNSSLPILKIQQNMNDSSIGMDTYIDWDGHPGRYVSEFMGYHGVWYQSLNQSSSDPCIMAGHIHVGGLVDLEDAKNATKITLRTIIDELDQLSYVAGDVNQDEIVDILDLIIVVNSILGIEELSSIQIIVADINQDELINIQDLVGIINIILDF